MATALHELIDIHRLHLRPLLHLHLVDVPPEEPHREGHDVRHGRATGATILVLFGDTATLAGVLAEDVVYYSDAGGKAPAALRPIVGRDKVVRLIKGLAAKGASTIREIRPVQINGVPGFVIKRTSGEVNAIAFDFRDGRIANIYLMLNPEKLRHLSAAS